MGGHKARRCKLFGFLMCQLGRWGKDTREGVEPADVRM